MIFHPTLNNNNATELIIIRWIERGEMIMMRRWRMMMTRMRMMEGVVDMLSSHRWVDVYIVISLKIAVHIISMQILVVATTSISVLLSLFSQLECVVRSIMIISLNRIDTLLRAGQR